MARTVDLFSKVEVSRASVWWAPHLRARGARHDVRPGGGVSAAPIVGSLVAAGMGATQLQDLMASLDYTRFRRRHPPRSCPRGR